MRLPVNHSLPLAALILLGGCAIGGTAARAPLAPPPANGPAADYPMIVGDPFTIDGTTYTPVDTLNYDSVGYATVMDGSDPKASGAHKTLPLPSYVEVTALETGRTIVVRLEKRGPMRNDSLVELTTGAATQLGIEAGAPVRVRRVNPPESERAVLRSGEPAPVRMDTPKALLTVLSRKLSEQAPLGPPKTAAIAAVDPDKAANDREEATPPKLSTLPEKPAITPHKPASPKAPDLALADPEPVSAKADKKEKAKVTPATAAANAAKGAFVVQVAAFSTQERADSAAAGLSGAEISKPGKYWLMRIGPFTTRKDASAALAKARAAGYSDARIQHAG
ncbi:MAG: SPOR domain-containing protein [Novosphingobium sp.]|nr:SPOR domain-containing protein [Novosphingobium sp.]